MVPDASLLGAQLIRTGLASLSSLSFSLLLNLVPHTFNILFVWAEHVFYICNNQKNKVFVFFIITTHYYNRSIYQVSIYN